jgi:hypothetical protein
MRPPFVFTGPEPHKLTEVDVLAKRAVCSVCGPVAILVEKGGRVCATRRRECRKRARDRLSAKRKGAKQVWLSENARGYGNDHRRFVKPVCERCGFQSAHIDQIDIHHKDRNPKNNHISNLLSLCANCHRLEHAFDDRG